MFTKKRDKKVHYNLKTNLKHSRSVNNTLTEAFVSPYKLHFRTIYLYQTLRF